MSDTAGDDAVMPEAEALIWDRYRALITQWRDERRRYVIANYRHAEAATAPTLLAPPVYPQFPPPPPVHPITALTPPSRPKVWTPVLAGVGAGLTADAVFPLLMANGWHSSPGNQILPWLVLVGAVIFIMVGGTTATITALVARSTYRTRLARYHAAIPAANASVDRQEAQLAAVRRHQLDIAAAHMDWEKQNLAWQRQQQQRQHPAADEAILAQWDEQTPSVIEQAVRQAQFDGSTPDGVPAGLALTAQQMYVTAGIVRDLSAIGLVRADEIGDTRTVLTLHETPCGPTTVLLHHTPSGAAGGETFVLGYDDTTVLYRPAPGMNHTPPEGTATRVVHAHTHWKVNRIPERGYGLIGSGSYLAEPRTVVKAVTDARP